MKNQNDLIAMIVAVVVSLGVGLGFFFTRRTPQTIADPAPVTVTAAKPPEGAVVMANGLPGAGNRGGGAAGSVGGAPSGAMGMARPKGRAGM